MVIGLLLLLSRVEVRLGGRGVSCWKTMADYDDEYYVMIRLLPRLLYIILFA